MNLGNERISRHATSALRHSGSLSSLGVIGMGCRRECFRVVVLDGVLL